MEQNTSFGWIGFPGLLSHRGKARMTDIIVTMTSVYSCTAWPGSDCPCEDILLLIAASGREECYDNAATPPSIEIVSMPGVSILV